jgi:hypothetical protein
MAYYKNVSRYFKVKGLTCEHNMNLKEPMKELIINCHESSMIKRQNFDLPLKEKSFYAIWQINQKY